MVSVRDFLPDWASPPGDTISDILRQRAVSPVEFASELGCSFEEARGILDGDTRITIGLARDLNRLLGASVEFWMSRDDQYRQDLTRLEFEGRSWLRELPTSDMVKFDWIEQQANSALLVAACLRFFGSRSIRSWRDTFDGLEQMAAFRTSETFESSRGSTAAWLRQGELEAAQIDCEPWDAERLEASLAQMRTLTRIHDPKRFLPALQERCAESGVAVVVIRAPDGCRASGATRFLSRQRALIQLSFRYLTDDHFWFSFFHEVAHLILHAESRLLPDETDEDGPWILEGDERITTPDEENADQFAENILIPPDVQHELGQIKLDHRSVISFARRLGIAPGIVVGQLQHDGRLPHSHLNRLKRRFAWSD